jgi:LAO/AO transport system kinase
VAQRDEGIAEVLAALQRHYTWLTSSTEGQARQIERVRGELLVLLRERLNEWVFERQRGPIEALADRVSRGEIDPYAAVQSLLGSAGLV